MMADLAIAVSAANSMLESHAGPGPGSLSEAFRRLIEEGSQLLRINLRGGNYWWSTRIFLVAAIAQDYTEVQALVFVHDDAESFVGIGSPGAVRKGLAAHFTGYQYEAAYTKARATALTEMRDLDNLPPSESAALEVDALLRGWQSAWRPPNPPEHDAQQIVSGRALREWLPQGLDTRSVRDGPLTESLLYKILSHETRYVALTDDSRLERVIDRDQLAVRILTDELEGRLDTAHPG